MRDENGAYTIKTYADGLNFYGRGTGCFMGHMECLREFFDVPNEAGKLFFKIFDWSTDALFDTEEVEEKYGYYARTTNAGLLLLQRGTAGTYYLVEMSRSMDNEIRRLLDPHYGEEPYHPFLIWVEYE